MNSTLSLEQVNGVDANGVSILLRCTSPKTSQVDQTPHENNKARYKNDAPEYSNSPRMCGGLYLCSFGPNPSKSSLNT